MPALPANVPMTPAFKVRMAQLEDVPAIAWLDTFGTSPHRNISRHVDKYFGSVDPSIHERNLIFLAELDDQTTTALPYPLVGKVELLLAPDDEPSAIGYIKRVIVHPQWRKQQVAQIIIRHIIANAAMYHVQQLDLHVSVDNAAAIRLYQSLGFTEKHREIYMSLEM